MKPKFGIYVLPWGTKIPSLEQVCEFAILAERSGFDSIQLPTHVTRPDTHFFGEFPNEYMLDPITMTGAIAAMTKKIKIGVNAFILPTLHPFMWAKFTSTLDVLSGGRALFAGTVGWWKDDFQVPEVDIHKRGAMTEEQLVVIKELFTKKSVDHKGEFYNFKASLEPKPVQKPHPPIWYSAGAFLTSIKRAARHADYYCTAQQPVEQTREIANMLKEESSVAKRDVKLALFQFAGVALNDQMLKKEILPSLKSVMSPALLGKTPAGTTRAEFMLHNTITGSPEDCLDRIHEYQDAGVNYFLVDFYYHGLKTIEYGMKQLDIFQDKVLSKI